LGCDTASIHQSSLITIIVCIIHSSFIRQQANYIWPQQQSRQADAADIQTPTTTTEATKKTKQ
jgi:hypothetical protein